MDPFKQFSDTQQYIPKDSQKKSIKSTIVDAGIITGSAIAGYTAPYITYNSQKEAVDVLIETHRNVLLNNFNNDKTARILKKLSRGYLILSKKYYQIKNEIHQNKIKTLEQQRMLHKIDIKDPKISFKLRVMSDSYHFLFDKMVDKPSKEFAEKELSNFEVKFSKSKPMFAGIGLLVGIAAVVTKYMLQKNKKSEL